MPETKFKLLKESNLSDSQKAVKSQEIQALLKDWRNTHFLLSLGDAAEVPPTPAEPEVLMGATGPLIFVKDKPMKKGTKVAKEEEAKKEAAAKAAKAAAQQETPNIEVLPVKPDRSKSFRVKQIETTPVKKCQLRTLPTSETETEMEILRLRPPPNRYFCRKTHSKRPEVKCLFLI